MEFQKEELVTREKEIAAYLLQNFSLKQVSEKTGLSKKHLTAHLLNMMKKLNVENVLALKNFLRNK